MDGVYRCCLIHRLCLPPCGKAITICFNLHFKVQYKNSYLHFMLFIICNNEIIKNTYKSNFYTILNNCII